LEIERALLNQERVLSRVGTESIQRRSTVNYQKLQIAVSQIVYNDAIIEAFAIRDRDEIAKFASLLMGDLLAVNIDIFNFYLPDNTVFYQGNKQIKHLNDSLFQQSVVEVNQNNRPSDVLPPPTEVGASWDVPANAGIMTKLSPFAQRFLYNL